MFNWFIEVQHEKSSLEEENYKSRTVAVIALSQIDAVRIGITPVQTRFHTYLNVTKVLLSTHRSLDEKTRVDWCLTNFDTLS